MFKRNANILGLALGSAAGQGSYFIASAYMVLRGMLEQQAQLAILFSLTTLSLWLVDFSTSTILARKISLAKGNVRRLIGAAVKLRLRLSAAHVPIMIAVLVTSTKVPPIEVSILLIAQCIAWSFNLSGYFDGTKDNIFAGPISSLNWLFASAYILLGGGVSPSEVSTAYQYFALGTILTTLIQWGLYKTKTFDKEEGRIDESSIAFGEVFHLSVGSITAQGYPRLILLATYHLVTPAAAAILSFAKSALNGVGMIVSIVRRHDLIDLVEIVERRKTVTVRDLLWMQRKSIGLGSAGYAASGVLIFAIATDNIDQHISFIFLLHVSAVAWLFSSALLQSTLAAGDYRGYSRCVVLSVVFNLVAGLLCYSFIDEYAIVLGEIVMCGVQAIYFFKVREK